MRTIADAVDLYATRRPADVAVREDGRAFTWEDLRAASDALAIALLDLGCRPGDPVLVVLPSGVEQVVARVACEKAGLPAATVSMTFREAEVGAIVGHLRPVAVVAYAAWRDTDVVALVRAAWPADVPAPLLVVAGEGVPAGAHAYAELVRRPLPADAAERLAATRYALAHSVEVQTTSGSTGTPKLVEVSQRARMLTGHVQAQRFEITARDTVLACTPLISGTSEALVYHTVLELGGTAALLPHFSEDEAVDALARTRASGAVMVPAMLARLLDHPRFTSEALPDLRVVASHGAGLGGEVGRAVEARVGCRIVQAYGTADFGGITASYYRRPFERRAATVGVPLDGNEVRLVDEAGGDVRPGEVGRVLVRGPHRAGSYLRNEALSQEAWASGYFDVQEYAWADQTGCLTLAGRAKDVIIRGGQNVYAADLEDLLLRHPGIAEAAVMAMPDPVLGERVCLYAVPRNGAALTLAEVTRFLDAERVARYKYPERLEVLPALPRMSGMLKVDKRALREDLETRLSAG